MSPENEWQRRYEQSIAAQAEHDNAMLAAASPTKRAAAGALGILSILIRLALILGYLAFAIGLFAQATAAGVVLGVVLLMLLSLSAFHTSQVVARRRKRNRHWLSGLP